MQKRIVISLEHHYIKSLIKTKYLHEEKRDLCEIYILQSDSLLKGGRGICSREEHSFPPLDWAWLRTAPPGIVVLLHMSCQQSKQVQRSIIIFELVVTL